MSVRPLNRRVQSVSKLAERSMAKSSSLTSMSDTRFAINRLSSLLHTSHSSFTSFFHKPVARLFQTGFELCPQDAPSIQLLRSGGVLQASPKWSRAKPHRQNCLYAFWALRSDLEATLFVIFMQYFLVLATEGFNQTHRIPLRYGPVPTSK